jgi:hypothetical protein
LRVLAARAAAPPKSKSPVTTMIQLAAEHAALRVDIVDRHLRGLGGVAVVGCGEAALRDGRADDDGAALREGRAAGDGDERQRRHGSASPQNPQNSRHATPSSMCRY